MDLTPGFEKAFQCPVCHSHPSLIFGCTACGEIRCSSHRCTGSGESGYTRWAAEKVRCHHCRKGHYQRLGFHSTELQIFLNRYSEKMEQSRSLRDFFTDAA